MSKWVIEFQESDKSTDNVILPEAEYTLVITGVELKIAKNPDENGNEKKYFLWTFQVKDHELYEGVSIKDMTTLVKGKRWKLWQILKSIKVNENMEKEGKVNFEPSDVIGKELKAFVGVKEEYYNGNPITKNIIKKYDASIPF